MTCYLCGLSTDRLIELCLFCERALIQTQVSKLNVFQITQKIIHLNHIRYLPILYITPYESLIVKLLHQLKFNQKLIIAKLLGSILGQILDRFYQEPIAQIQFPTVLIPMPLSDQRYRARGFNQVFELARWVNRYFQIPIETNWIKRVVHTKAQAQLSKTRRLKNLKQAFRWVGTLDASVVSSFQKIIILEDIVTTGVTCTELANTIFEQLPNCLIEVWCVAH
jgi:ComF family protein